MVLKDKKKFILAFFVIIFGTALRIFLNKIVGIPNFEAITSLSLLTGSFFGAPYSIFIPLLTIFLSDIYFGNSIIYFFTWSAFILTGLLGSYLKRRSKNYSSKIIGMGIFAVFFFYLWTNFGWWLVAGMYPMTLQGLTQCYIAALPFLKNQLFSIFIFVPIFNSIFSFTFAKFLEQETLKTPNQRDSHISKRFARPPQ